MPINRISKWLQPGATRRKPLRSDAEQALTQLAHLSEQHPDLAELAATHAALLRVAFVEGEADTLPVPDVSLDRAYAATKLQAGVPLLRGEQLALNAAWLQARYLELCNALLDLPETSGDAGAYARRSVESIRQAVKRGTLDIYAATIDLIAGDPSMIMQRAAQLDLDTALAATLLRWTLLPLLEQVAKQLQPLRKNLSWEKGYCPTCGAWPLLAERRGIEQKLFLRCGLCAGEWEIDHIYCPFCNSRSHFDIAYLYDEAQEPTERAITCERCHCYFKSVTTLAAIPTPQLAVTDLATLHLDVIALERAYGPPG